MLFLNISKETRSHPEKRKENLRRSVNLKEMQTMRKPQKKKL
jgi:hypothetical protein